MSSSPPHAHAPPEASLQALMDAAARVSGLPGLPFQARASLFPGSSAAAVAPRALPHPHPVPSASIRGGLGAGAAFAGPPPAPFRAVPFRAVPFQASPLLLAAPRRVGGGPLRKRDHDSALAASAAREAAAAAERRVRTAGASRGTEARVAKKVRRLEQNRLAAIESRRRKKHMVEEVRSPSVRPGSISSLPLRRRVPHRAFFRPPPRAPSWLFRQLQRSVQFYSKANSTLKRQNAELERQLLVAKEKVLARKEGKPEAEGAEAKEGLVSKVEAVVPIAAEREAAGAAQERQRCPEADESSALATARPFDAERRARKAQLAATQALYHTMGYPSGAARVAATALSQGVDRDAAVAERPPTEAAPAPGPVAPPSALVAPPSALAAPPVARVETEPHRPFPSAPKLPAPESDDEWAYVQALNRFAMQQAAAANAAAAAATAAIEAARLHHQRRQKKSSAPLRRGGGDEPSSSSSSARSAPSLPFSLPVGPSWPFQEGGL
ncbi:hypothetical protein ACHAWF_003830 [Thalassiosira exigua]